jgi:hypothetical protein
VASGFRWGLPCLLSTPLRIHQEISRVQHGQLKQNDVGGVFLLVPSALCGSPVFPWGKTGLPMSPRPTASPGQHWSLLSRVSHEFRLYWLTSQTRYVRVYVPRRTMHASGDSPYRSSAKHHLLRACLSLMAPFRSMLLTLQSGLQSLGGSPK